MTRAEFVIDRLLIDAKQALDQMPPDEDAATLEALGEIRARIAHEVATLGPLRRAPGSVRATSSCASRPCAWR